MQTHIADFIKDTDAGKEAERILRTCTHCGFCLATCPTYQELGNELDSPRGRIYLIKQVLEGHEPTGETQLHLDRCLTCRACESTCPSGVEYSKLADIGREVVEQKVPRNEKRALRWFIRTAVPNPKVFSTLMTLGQAARPLVPGALRDKLPAKESAPTWPEAPKQATRRVLLLEGCAQPAMTPATNPETVRLLGEAGIEVVRTPKAGCCGALHQHLGEPEGAHGYMKRNIDAWWPEIQNGADAIVVNASGCGAQVKDYGYFLRNDPDYAEKAAEVARLAVDPVELIEGMADRLAPRADAPRRIAFHCPCTLQHGQKMPGRVEAVLRKAGFELTPIGEPHLCCGSAGSYSVLQPEMAKRLRRRKLDNIEPAKPEMIVTANVGCQTHLGDEAKVPVRHWVELLTVR
ncbi:glycolate oxidase iron-sulfur subunit [Alkalispirillum mobile]|uniref:Glycolate oxidase iron-sulfur subunit n=1 Tax=Alkalispirillum mobile TaxID=85925 RepID=A0A498CE99_9GAMM|nr:glycolate oxidase subunit GlcF [Alkalispirillum mobile]RLK50758.1 glycolate oxidase iron-sulfur subunit [Alkalispirillum mobile]